MPAITASAISAGANAVTETTLTASDTLTYVRNAQQLLILKNGTAGALTVNIDGDGATTVGVAGVGSVDVSSGFSTGAIAAGAAVAIPLDSIRSYLSGVVTVTGGAGITATLLTF
jgi:hypothetical protein